ncbi:MAG: UDP-N-acetylmuramate--L-alanine ligase, partial [Candidatus Sungbacteria bacterium]|nr:UDP-N-acetylmuramate--L-alanine ligase [Candidatus Sungbacteria bacterium]
MRIHFVGIGGIGVSSLARYYLSHHMQVSGSDLASSEITEELARLGVAIAIGPHAIANMPADADLVVYSPAIPPTNDELQEAHRRGILVRSHPEAVGELTKQYQTITVSGAHGKSTTTALAALVMEEGYCDPTVIVGAKIKEFGNANFRRGHGPFLLLEADEWNKSFLNYSPFIAIVTNIDAEHLDTYKTLAGVKRAFSAYLKKIPKNGIIIANADDLLLADLCKKIHKKIVWYSLADDEARRIEAILQIPGAHNLSNALAAYRLGTVLGIAPEHILKGIARFSGAWRRFEFYGVVNNAIIIADYGHHPKEITATINAARSRFPFRRIWCVFQPHLRQRLADLWDDFVQAFDLADRVSLLEVYNVAGRETKKIKPSVSSRNLAIAIQTRGKDASYMESFASAEADIKREARSGDVILMMGAGDIYALTKKLTEQPFSGAIPR